MPTPLPALKVEIAHIDEACVVRVQGELDITGCPELELALEGAELTQADRIVVDLEELEFIDGRGLHTLLEAARRSACNGNRLQVTQGRAQVARMLELADIANLLPLVDPCMCPAIRAPGPRSRAGPGRKRFPSDRRSHQLSSTAEGICSGA